MSEKTEADKQAKTEAMDTNEEEVANKPNEVEEEKSKPTEETEKVKGDAKVVENGEQPAGKRASLRPLVTSLKERVDKLSELTHPELDDKDDFSDICSEARKIRQLAEDVISTATKRVRAKAATDPAQYQYIAKVRGLQVKHFRDMRNLMQNALGLRTVKFTTPVRNSPFVDINFASEEIMEKGVKILRGEPLGLTLSVIATKKVDKKNLQPESVLQPLDTEFDPTVALKESLTRTREITEEESTKLAEWKDKYTKHMLKVMCDKLDPDVSLIIKDPTEGYYFKLEEMRSPSAKETETERFQTYSGINPETEKVEMGYWLLGSDVRSRVPRTKAIQDTLKVLTDFMESSGKSFFDLRVRKGYWKSVMIRSNHVGQCMVVLIVHTGNEADTAKDCEALKTQLTELFETGPGKDCEVKSIHVKSLTESGKTETTHLFGDEHLEEEVAELKLHLHSNSLFWNDGCNTEQLFQAVVDELGLDEESGVLNMVIATGLFSMYMAKHCKMVCGVDRVQNAVAPAQKNAEMNDLKNIVFLHNSASTTFTSLQKHFEGCNKISAFVMETSSNSFNRDEILNIRRSSWIKKVAYLIVSFKDVTSTIKLLCTKKIKNSDDQFVITKVIPFDSTFMNLRPDVLVLFERASALEDRTEARVPKTKPKAGMSGGPPNKKMKLSPGGMGGPRSRMQGKKFGGLLREPLLQGARGYMGRNYSQRGGVSPWDQGSSGRAPPLLQFENDSRYRLEEEAMLLERARLQKEAQLQQMQEVVLEAQRRRIADALLPTPPVQNIEDVVLSAIKKTGLLDKVAALSDTPSRRYNESQYEDRWGSDYRQQGSSARSSFSDNTSRYQGQDSSRYQNSFGYRNRETSRYQDRRGSANSSYKSRRNY